MRIIFTILFVLLSFLVFSREYSSNLINAMRNGANANIEIHVADEDRNPVPSAKIRVFMGMNFRERGYWLEGVTDTNGVFVIDGKTTGNEIEIYLSKCGYYDSYKKLCFVGMGNEREVKDGKWQPYAEKLCIALNHRRNPIPMSSISSKKFVLTKAINTWLGYDLNKHDYVSPYGKGEVADLELFFNWDGEWYPKYKGMELKIRFLGPCSGYYCCPKNDVSVFNGPYTAQLNAQYGQYATFFERVVSERKRERKLFNSANCWVVRSRCKVDECGKLVSAHYSVLYDIGFCCEEGSTAGFYFLGAFNPIPNDTNLEATCR